MRVTALLLPVVLALLALVISAVRRVREARQAQLRIRVRGNSMSPTFHDGQRLTLRRTPPGTRFATGDVVLFHWKTLTVSVDGLRHMVKRVAATEGEPVPEWARASLGEGLVPASQVVVRGDNPESIDSRKLGFVPIEEIVGRVMD